MGQLVQGFMLLIACTQLGEGGGGEDTYSKRFHTLYTFGASMLGWWAIPVPHRVVHRNANKAGLHIWDWDRSGGNSSPHFAVDLSPIFKPHAGTLPCSGYTAGAFGERSLLNPAHAGTSSLNLQYK